MKKTFAIMLTSVLVLSMLCGCNGNEEKPHSGSEKQSQNADQDKPPEKQEKQDRDSLNIPAVITLQDTDILKGKKLGCTICYKGDEWCSALATALETLGNYYGATIDCEDGDLNDETQTKQIESMVANRCDMIFADPITADGCHEALMKAHEENIPIIIYDGEWSDGEKNAVTNVTWDQKATGELVGEYLVDYIKNNMDGKAKLIEVFVASAPQNIQRFEGFHEVIDKANANGCNIEVLGRHDCEGNREKAYNAISAISTPYDFIVSAVDNGAMGAVAALNATGNTHVKVLSMGAYGEEPFTLLHDHDANYLACVNVDAWVLAQNVFDGAIGYFKGEKLPVKNNIKLYIVDSDNVEKFWSFD